MGRYTINHDNMDERRLAFFDNVEKMLNALCEEVDYNWIAEQWEILASLDTRKKGIDALCLGVWLSI